MTRQMFKRILAFTMACLLLPACFGQALADQVYVMRNSAVYAAPRSGAEKLGSLKIGEQVELVAEKDGWAMVQKGGYTGYMNAAALSEIEDLDNMTAYTKARTPMYRSYSTSAKKLGTIPTGEMVTVAARAGNWAYIAYAGYRGFVKTSNLTTTAPEAQEEAQTSMTVYAGRDGAPVYNRSGKVIGSVDVNTEMTLTAMKGSVCQVTRSGKTAYMMKADLSASPVTVEASTPTPQPEPSATPTPEVQSVTAYVKNDGAKVYNASGKAIGTLDLNESVTVTAVKSGVCRVTRDGNTAYMKKSDLSTEKTEASESVQSITAYVKNDGAKVYNLSGKVIGTLEANTSLSVTGINGNICRVVKNGSTAYMMKGDLSSAPVEETDDGVVEIPRTTGYVKNEGAKVYDASGKVIATLKLNTRWSTAPPWDTWKNPTCPPPKWRRMT